MNELTSLGSGYCISQDKRKGICYEATECTNRLRILMGSCSDENSTPGSIKFSVCYLFKYKY